MDHFVRLSVVFAVSITVQLSASMAWGIPPLPPRTAKVCHGCQSDADCDAKSFCLGASRGIGYCLQPCTGQACPNGFVCENLAPGIEQCVPQEGAGCFAECSAQKACPSGFDCTQGRCLRTGGGKEGDFCDAKAPCASAFQCVQDLNKQGRCVTRCGPAPGAAGGPCKNAACDAGLRCAKSGTTEVCVKSCSGQCSGNQKCTQFSNAMGCTCQKDGDCDAGEVCHRGVLGFQGVCGKPTGKNCPSGRSCADIATQGSFCVPDKGWRHPGASCGYLHPCRGGLSCRKFTADSKAQCYQNCQKPGDCAQGSGTCDFMTRTGQFCFCLQSKDCDNERICRPIKGTPVNYGLCQLSAKSQCKSNDECPPRYTCQGGKCAPGTSPPKEASGEPARSEASKEPSPPDARAPEPSARPEPRAPEPSARPEPRSSSETSQPTPETAGQEKAPDAGTPPDPPKPPSGCKCSASTPSSTWLAMLCVLLLWITRKPT